MFALGNVFSRMRLKFTAKKPLVGIYGVTSVGKSTFLNVLLKSNEFKSSMGETTKKVHVLQHTKDQREIDFPNTALEKEYIKKQFSILESFSIVDIPGTSKSFSSDDILAVTDELDVVIWMFDIHGDISEKDSNFLQKIILKNMVKVIVILNKVDSGIDDIDFEDAEEEQEFIEQIIARKTSIEDFFQKYNAAPLLVDVIPVSAKQLLKNILGDKSPELLKQNKLIDNTLISAAKDSSKQRAKYRDAYNEIKDNVLVELDKAEELTSAAFENDLRAALNQVSDNDIASGDLDMSLIGDDVREKLIENITNKYDYEKKLKQI